MKWREVILNEICTSQYGYTASAEEQNVGLKFLRITDIVPETINWLSVPYCAIDEEDIKKYKLEKGDIVIARTGNTTGYAKLIRDDVDAVFASYLIRLRVNPLIANPQYIGRLIESKIYKSFVNSIKGGSAQGNANAKMLTLFKFKIPPLPIQQKIADILSKYDDLIENNRRRIELLERSARLLYKEWFVRLRFPGHEHTPIIDGIPEGWEKVKLQSIIKIFHGFAFRSEQFVEQKTNTIVVRMGNFKEEGGLKFEEKDNKYLIENSYNEKYLLKPRDLLMVLSDVTRDGRIIGNVGFVPNDNNLYVLNQRVARIEAPEDLKLYLYCSFGSSLYKNHCLSRANSVTVLNLKNDHIYEYQILIPDHQRLLIFSGIVKSIVNNIHVLEQQNQKLKQARDIS
jgi:type I restriction enzyme S subunit